MVLSDKLLDFVNDYSKWMQNNELMAGEVAYARICRCSHNACVGVMKLEDGIVYFQPRHVNDSAIGKMLRSILFRIKYIGISLWWKVKGYPDESDFKFGDSFGEEEDDE